MCFTYLRLEKFQIEFSRFLRMFAACIVGGFIGSKILFAITQIPWLVKNFSLQNLLLLIPQSGFVFYGGLFGVVFTIVFLTRREENLRKRIFQMCVPAMPLFHTFGRIGCFLSGCCYGKNLSQPIIIGTLEIAQVPVQLIEAVAELTLFGILLVVEHKKKDTNLLELYLVSYAIIRFLDEFFRGDEIRGIFWGLSTAQWISIIIVLFYVFKRIRIGLHD